ncbi:zinc finger protein 320-like [Hetaerina americana]|uniref:zinc finger protein 320-like n=1 Tax=Hetaerina americana TaxID=62018 RepID=UPI003A7F2DD6
MKMPRHESLKCRLCLHSGGRFTNIFYENNHAEKLVREAIEELLELKVVRDRSNPWLLCYQCFKLLTDFYVFKQKCRENNLLLERQRKNNREERLPCRSKRNLKIKRESNDLSNGSDEDFANHGIVTRSASKSEERSILRYLNNEESDVDSEDGKDFESPGMELVDVASSNTRELSINVEYVDHSVQTEMDEMENTYSVRSTQVSTILKKELVDEAIPSDDINTRSVAVHDEMITVKEEIDAASKCSAVSGTDIGSSIVPSTEECGCHQSDNEEAGNLEYSVDEQLQLSITEEVDNDEECDVKIRQGDLGVEVLRMLGDDQRKKGTQNPMHRCQICNKVFAKQSILKTHVMNEHLQKGRKLKCDVCLEVFECKNDLDGHVKTMHAAKKKYQCQHCSRYFQKPSQLRNHMETHLGKTFNKCKRGLKGYKQKPGLDSQMLRHRVKEEYKCDNCLKVFSGKRGLNRHILAHTCEKKHICILCSMVFTRKASLNRHMVVHSDKRPEKCNVCSKTFNRKAYLASHMLVHTGEKPHKCKHCPKEFALKQTLNGHMRLHSGEKPYICKICTRAFSDKANLKRHIWTHSDERSLKCDVCSKGFMNDMHLRRHQKVHLRKTSLKCYHCEFTSTYKIVLRRHIVKVH